MTNSFNSNIKIISDDPTLNDSLDFKTYSKNLSNLIINSKPKFSIGVFGQWGTGKTSLMKMIENDITQEKKEVLTVWFEPWKYENEKYFTIVPLLRTIRIALENTFNDNKIRQIKNGLNNTLKAVFTSIEFNSSLGQVGMNIDFEKVIENLKTKESCCY